MRFVYGNVFLEQSVTSSEVDILSFMWVVLGTRALSDAFFLKAGSQSCEKRVLSSFSLSIWLSLSLQQLATHWLHFRAISYWG